MRSKVLLGSVLAFAAGLIGCGATPQDMEEIKSAQKDILAKVDALSGEVKKLASARPAGRPPGPDPNKVHNIPVGNSPIMGNVDAKVTLVAFSDYLCGHCRNLDPTIHEVVEKYPNDVRYVHKNWSFLGAGSMLASKAVLAAGKQGKYWEMHKAIYGGGRASGTDEALKKYATDIGLDMAKWDADRNSKEIADQIQQELAQGRGVGVSGTPAVYVNGKRYSGPRSVEGFSSVIDAALKG